MDELEREWTPCPGCGARGDEEHRTIAFSGRPANGEAGFQIVRCGKCGLHFTNPRPRVENLGKYYGEDYLPHQSFASHPAGRDGSIRSLVLRDAFGSPERKPSGVALAVAKAVRVVRPAEWFGMGVPWRGRGRLLDVGCGAGKFLCRMRDLGWEATGLDFSARAVEAVRKLGVNAFHGTLPHAELAAGSFDVVCMRHTLEHVPEPRIMLRSAWELLDRGGMLLVQVPNFATWDVRWFGDEAQALDLPRHLTHFTPATLKELLEREGMTRVNVRQASHASLIRKGAKRTTRTGIARMLRVSVAARVASVMESVAGRGNEIIATAEKA
jgi:2-polyprenyl-3-methyl-5-hydroxy-6-metoxy-1,4-benzoquinol methylase